MERGKPRVVAVSVTGQGHISPLMHLCGDLANHGFAVTFILLADSVGTLDLIHSKGTWPPAGLDISLEALDNGIPFPVHAVTEERLDLAVIHTHNRTYQQQLEEFVRKLDRVRCIVCDYQMAWSIDAAVNLGIPGAVLFTGCATWSWFELNMPRFVASGMIPDLDGEELGKDEDYVVLDQPKLLRSAIPWHFWADRPWQEFTVQYNSGVFRKVAWVLSSSVDVLESEMVRKMKEEVGDDKFLTIAPLFLINNDPSSVGLRSFDAGVLEWLDKQPASSVLYVAFGSLAKQSREQIEELAMGIEASECRFLWVSRNSSQEQQFLMEFSERNRRRGLVVSWSPQTQVLCHNSVAAFVSHCGWNSTIEAVANGKPILCWPCQFDQNINSRLVIEDWKVGTGFARSSSSRLVERTEVERGIRLIMEGDEGRKMSERSQKLSVEIRKAVLPGGSSYINLDEFRKNILNHEAKY